MSESAAQGRRIGVDACWCSEDDNEPKYGHADDHILGRMPTDRSAAQTSEWITIPREQLAEIAEDLADALHDHNIGRDIRANRTTSEVFGSLKAILSGRYSPEVRYE